MEKKVTSNVIKGIIIALIVIVIDLIGHFTNMVFNSWYKWLSTIILLGGIIWSVISYGKEMDNNVTFGNLFAYGFKVSAAIACIVFIYTILTVYFLFPDFINQIVDKAMDEARKQGKVSEDQLQQGMGLIKKITSISMLVGSILGTLIVGAIASLIGAAIAKKNPPSAFDFDKQVK